MESYPSRDKDLLTFFPSFAHCLPASSTLFPSKPARSTRLILLVFELPKHFEEVSCEVN